MKVTIKQNSLNDTLKEVERLSTKYSSDIGNLKNFTLKEFFKFVSCNIRYQKDPKDYQVIMRPKITLEKGFGDCDDKTVLCLAYFIENKISCGYSVVSQRIDKELHHIFPIFKLNGKLYDFDATYPNNLFLKEQTGFTKRVDNLFYKGEEMKTVILEGNDFDLRDYQYQLSGGLSGEMSGLKKSLKKTVKKVSSPVTSVIPSSITKAVSNVTSQVIKNDIVQNLQAKAESQINKQVDILNEKAIQKVETKVKSKLKEYSSIDGLVALQLKSMAISSDEFLNNIPVVGSINRGATIILGESPSQIIIEKGGKKLVSYSLDKVKEQTGKIISKYIPNTLDSDIPMDKQTGVFTQYLFENPDFTKFNKTNDELIVIPPDEMFSHINKFIESNNYEKLIYCDNKIPADIAKIYYFTAGQPLYNAYNKLLHEQITGVTSELQNIQENPEKINSLIISKEQNVALSYNSKIEADNKEKQLTVPKVSVSTAKEIQKEESKKPLQSDNKLLVPVGLIAGLFILKKINS
ncbi:MAG: transglutaminase-like domain-containing protein [Vampirovibrionia bacterium]